jgi:hypothetical protein
MPICPDCGLAADEADGGLGTGVVIIARDSIVECVRAQLQDEAEPVALANFNAELKRS